jgi:hypothetical protein
MFNAPTKGGVFTITVASQQNCDYAVKSDASWLSVMSSAAMSGSGTMAFRVSVNPTITREGTISVGGQAVTVRQSRN